MDVIWLDAQNTCDPREVGSKAAGLLRLLRLGFLVPRGFVVTASAFQKFLDGVGLTSKLDVLPKCTREDELEPKMRHIQGVIEAGVLPEGVKHSIGIAYKTLGGKVAVRSSGNLEDTEQSAFAGAYASFLNRTGEKEVLDAIRDCWNSAFSPKVVAYRLQHGLIGGDWLMGVIVQTMVDANKAGVMFTRNPFGERDTILVEAVSGGCDRIVSGAPADLSVRIDWTTRKAEYVKRAPSVLRRFGTGAVGLLGDNSEQSPKLLRRREIDALVNVAVRLEDALHQPQDVEWAIADGQLILLQTRPLTGYSMINRR